MANGEGHGFWDDPLSGQLKGVKKMVNPDKRDQVSAELLDAFPDELPSILAGAEYTEVWGTDLRASDEGTIKFILQKYLSQYSAIPALQLPRARFAPARTLRCRRTVNPQDLVGGTSLISDLDLFRVSHFDGQHVMWAIIDEKAIKGYGISNEQLPSFHGFGKLGIAALEALAMLILTPTVTAEEAVLVVEFRNCASPGGRQKTRRTDRVIGSGLEQLVPLIHSHYPRLFSRAYLISPCERYVAPLTMSNSLLDQTIVLQNPEDLVSHLGSQVPTMYGGTGPPLKDCACFQSLELQKKLNECIAPVESEKHEVESGPPLHNYSPGSPQPRLNYSDGIGFPTIILVPGDLQSADNVLPDKSGARLVWADSGMIVKFGEGPAWQRLNLYIWYRKKPR